MILTFFINFVEKSCSAFFCVKKGFLSDIYRNAFWSFYIEKFYKVPTIFKHLFLQIGQKVIDQQKENWLNITLLSFEFQFFGPNLCLKQCRWQPLAPYSIKAVKIDFGSKFVIPWRRGSCLVSNSLKNCCCYWHIKKCYDEKLYVRETTY